MSVVVPTYNRRHYIGATIDSVLMQSYERLELIVVDDGSADGTREYVLDAFGSEPSPLPCRSLGSPIRRLNELGFVGVELWLCSLSNTTVLSLEGHLRLLLTSLAKLSEGNPTERCAKKVRLINTNLACS